MSRSARQFWTTLPGRGEIRTASLPPRQGDNVLVRALYSGISRGTEALVFKGDVPPSQYQAMRAPFQEGEFPGPVKYGYCSVGEVLEAPDSHREALLGKAIFSLYPHQDFYLLPASDPVVLPVGVPPARAVLAANMETAVNAVWDATPAVGDRIVVIGAGVVGMLVASLCGKVPGSRVTIVDIDPTRESVAKGLGLDFAERPPAGTEADLVFHASGTEDGLTSALAVAGLEATVVELSWFGSRSVTVPLGEAFHSRRLRLQSSQVGRIPSGRAARWSRRRRLELALELLRDPRLDALISGESDFESLPDVMSRLSRDGRGVLCHRIRYSEH